MKKKLLTLFLSILAHLAHAQTDIPEPFKGANIIVIHTSDSANVALKNISRAMMLQGCTVKNSDSDLGYVTAEIVLRSTWIMAMDTFKAVVIPEKGGVAIRMSGECVSTNSLKLIQSISYDKGSSIPREGFAKAQKIAQSYPNGRIGYALQE